MPVGLALGVLVVGALVAISASSGPAPGIAPRRKVMDIAARVIDYVAGGESKGRFWAQNRNTDGQGLSYGILQWTQRSGALGRLLAKMNTTNAVAFTSIFGADAARLLKTTSSADEAVRMSLPLWAEPWTSRFTALGHIRVFQLAQAEAGATGASWQATLDIARTFNTWTERALVLFFDRANHQGGYSARKVASTLHADLTGEGAVRVAYLDLLQTYANRCARPYRRSSAPGVATQTNGNTWKQVGVEWHLFAGSADLYAIIARRTAEILADSTLGDLALEPIA